MSLVNVSLAQINFRPCYISSGLDLLVEPHGDNTTSLTKLSDKHSREFIVQARSRYSSWLEKKVLAIIEAAIKSKSDILVFPEYSIPPELIESICKSIHKTDLTVVAGSHMVNINSVRVCEKIKLPVNEDMIGCAVCPILRPDFNHKIVFKYNRSKWESSLNVPQKESFSWIPMELSNGRKINIGVFICIDGLKNTFPEKKEENELIIIPAWSPSTEPFDAIGILAKFNEYPLIYVNTSAIGGSKVYAPFPESDRHWFAEKDSTKGIARNCEALLTLKLDLDNFRRSKSTTVEHIPAEIIDIENILYIVNTEHNSLSKQLNNMSVPIDIERIKYIMQSTNDQMLKSKMEEIINKQRVGMLNNTCLKSFNKHISVNEITFDELISKQINNAIRHLSQLITKGNTDTEVFKNLGILSSMNAQKEGSGGVQSNKDNIRQVNYSDVDTKPFFNREEELRQMRSFFSNGIYRLLLIQGIRGIGKTFFVEQIKKQVLPPNSPWRRFEIRFTSGMGFPLFIDELCYNLNITIRDNDYSDENNIRSILKQVFEALETYYAGYLIIDDFQHVLDNEGSFVDNRFGIFFDEFLKKHSESKANKIIVITNRNINNLSFDNVYVKTMVLRGMEDQALINIIDYYYRQFTGSVNGIETPGQFVKNLYGNPLAAVIAAQYLQYHSVESLQGNYDIFKRFQERLIERLLEDIKIEGEELELMNYLSTSKYNVSSKALYLWKPGISNTIEKLVSRFLIEFEPSTDSYRIHPLIRDYFYDKLQPSKRVEYHKALAEYNENIITQQKKNKQEIRPQQIAEVIYHYAGSLQRNKFMELQTRYFDELKPVADNLYVQKEYDKTIDYYEILNNFSSKKRVDVLVKLFKCYGNIGKWKDAEVYLEQATSINQRGAYIYAEYAAMLANKTNHYYEAESYAMKAEEVYYENNNNRRWELAKIKYAFGIIKDKLHDKTCIEFLKEANELDETNIRYKYRYAKCLLITGFSEAAIGIAEKGLQIDPQYKPLIDLKQGVIEELDDRVRENEG